MTLVLIGQSNSNTTLRINPVRFAVRSQFGYLEVDKQPGTENSVERGARLKTAMSGQLN